MEVASSMLGSWPCNHIGISGLRPAYGLPMLSMSSRKSVVVNCGTGGWATGRKYRFHRSFVRIVKQIGECEGRRFGRGGLFSRLASTRGILVRNSVNGGEYENPNDTSLPPALDDVLDYPGARNEGKKVIPSDHSGNLEGKRCSEVEFGVQDGYVGLFVRLLGLDNPVEEREGAVRALWRHSAGGKEFIDQIVEFPGCLNLIVTLLPSERAASSEAAAGLLRNISSVNAYRSAVAESGALEEIAGLLTRRSISSEVKLQATCVLWNLSVEEGPRQKLVQPEILQVLQAMLGSDIEGEREAAAGVIANLTLNLSNG